MGYTSNEKKVYFDFFEMYKVLCNIKNGILTVGSGFCRYREHYLKALDNITLIANGVTATQIADLKETLNSFFDSIRDKNFSYGIRYKKKYLSSIVLQLEFISNFCLKFTFLEKLELDAEFLATRK